jgi:DNA (cytosine-5)-methyltransferase 1
VPKSFFVPAARVKDWQYHKGGKQELRTNANNGFTYTYSEGAMSFPDPLDKPSRTIVTGEGGSGPSRFKHVVRTPEGKLRRLTPVELERLNMFPDGHTEGASDARRAFLMGNALVTGIVERVGRVLAERMG